MKNFILYLLPFLLCYCNKKTPEQTGADTTSVKLIVLGNVQDADSPHLGCQKNCCKNLWTQPD